MAILKIRDSDGNIQEITVIKGDQGEQGIQGEKGDKGDPGRDAEGAILYTPQGLTKEQQAQARKNIGAASQDDLYSISARYNSIEDALAGTNMISDGKVATHIIGDNINIILLDDIASDTTISITKDCTLHLNGKTLSFTAAGAYLNITTASKVTINGEVEGSKIVKFGITGATAAEYLIYTRNTHLFMLGGTYLMSNMNGKVSGITTSAGTHIDMENCVVNIHTIDGERVRGIACDFANIRNCIIDVVTDNSLAVQGILLYADSILENCKVIATARALRAQVHTVHVYGDSHAIINNCHIEADGYSDTYNEEGVLTIYGVYPILVSANASADINGGYYWGAREGLSIHGVTRINGGVFEGCQHGGAYMQGSDIKAKNAIFRNVDYKGTVGWKDNTHGGALYCGSKDNNDVNVYFDNCRFESNCYATSGIVAKETNTEVFLSNCVFDGDFDYDLRADKTCTIYVGKNVEYDTIGVPVNPDDTITYHGTIDTTTYADQEFGFETKTTDYGNLINIKVSLLQDKVKSSVLYTPQNKTEEEKAQARENIGAAEADKETPDKYFDIDYDGIISLKPKYRGDPPADAAYINAEKPDLSAYKDCISNNGIGVEGSKIAELPETIVIPTNVNGEQVTGFAKGMFAHNRRIKKVVLPSHIKTVINGMFRDAFNLETVENTEQIEAVKAGAFQRTRVQELHFPNLTEMGGSAFHTCYFLRVIDIGKVTSIGNMAFYQCENLMEILGGENVTTVGDGAFYLTRRLKTLPFIEKITDIRQAGFWASGCDLEGLPSDCKCGNFATYKHYEENNIANFTDYWSGATFTPCRNSLNSLFHQKDPRWADKQIGSFMKRNSDGTSTGEPLTYRKGCSFITLAEMYSAFEGVSFNSPEEFTPIIEDAMAEKGLKDLDPRWREHWVQLVRALGYEVVKVGGEDYITTMTTENLQVVYNELANGAFVYKSVMSNPDDTDTTLAAQGGHVALCYGINSKGEMLLSDTSMHCSDIGVYENHKSALPIYKHGSKHCDAVIVRKP